MREIFVDMRVAVPVFGLRGFYRQRFSVWPSVHAIVLILLSPMRCAGADWFLRWRFIQRSDGDWFCLRWFRRQLAPRG
jgi:hypothetical protein